MPRMRILTASEQEAFDTPPLFDHRERKRFFAFSTALRDSALTLRTPSSQIGFLVMCGYFKATKKFFLPRGFHERDVAAAVRVLGWQRADFNCDTYAKATRVRHQRLILDFYGVAPFDKKATATLAVEIATMARMHLKPRLIFDRCVDFLMQKRMQIPTSRSLTDMIRSGIQDRKSELVTLMDTHLTDAVRGLLDDLFTTPVAHNRYRLTLLKSLNQSTKPSRIKESIADYHTISALHAQLESILSIFGLGPAGVRYYAGSVLKSEIFQMRRREASDRYVHAAAFITHQFYRIQDHMVDILLSVMASFQTSVSRAHNEEILEQREEQQNVLKTAVDDLDRSVFNIIRRIRELTESNALSDSQKVVQIKAALNQGQPDALEQLKAKMELSGKEHSWHEVLERHSVRLQKRVSSILKVLNFEPTPRVLHLMAAIAHFKARDGAIGERAPIEFLSAEEQAALQRPEGAFRPSLYKVFLFQHIAGAIKAGDLNLAHSYKYRPMDAYLIAPQRWREERSHLLERAGLAEFADPEPVLKTLNVALTTQYQTTNANAEINPNLTFRKDGTFHITTPALDVSETDSPWELFPQRHDVPLAQVLETINNHCGMLAAFAHWQQTHSRQTPSRPALLAGIMGLGCGIGVRKMARISSQVTERELEHAVNWRFSLDNIRAANESVLQAMDKMDLPNVYRREHKRLHTASDGQKFEVRGDSLHASRSFKYFGQGQGVSAYTFVDERNLLWHSLVISAANRESAFVIDGLMHNDVVKSDIHSTDTHGYTEAIFGLTHLLGFSFAPRIKGIGKQTLYIFKPKNQTSKDWKIKPGKTINETVLRENWDDLLRLVATIKLKESTASDIFRRLNSYSRQHALYQTLKAFGQIIKSLFILRYINDVTLRQAIEKQLNKVELANRFTRAVAVGNPHGFTQVEKEEQEIAEACNRLIKNSIICWNYLYLSRQLEKATDPEANEALRKIIAKQSPMAWAHINMLGEYDFSEEKLKDSLGILPLKSAA